MLSVNATAKKLLLPPPSSPRVTLDTNAQGHCQRERRMASDFLGGRSHQLPAYTSSRSRGKFLCMMILLRKAGLAMMEARGNKLLNKSFSTPHTIYRVTTGYRVNPEIG